MNENKKLLLIAGPCVIENEENVLYIAKKMKEITDKLNIDYYFKASFDKANRTSINSYRGPGIEEGMRILKKVKEEVGVKIATDIHEPWQAAKVAEVVDVIQIPAFLCRQTDLLVAAAKTGKLINVKKAQFLAPWDMGNVVKKLEDSGNKNIMLCERGSCFGYNNLVVDFRAVPIMQSFGYPVVFDATHSVQLPGAQGTCSGGDRRFVPVLAKAAMAAGANALFFEVHPDPDCAKCDGPNMLALDSAESVFKICKEIFELVRK